LVGFDGKIAVRHNSQKGEERVGVQNNPKNPLVFYYDCWYFMTMKQRQLAMRNEQLAMKDSASRQSRLFLCSLLIVHWFCIPPQTVSKARKR